MNESVSIGSELLRVTASDPDQSRNAEIDYRLQAYQNVQADPSESATMFSISYEGVISLVQALDYETQRVHMFGVVATDRGTPPRSSSALVTLFVANELDEPPHIRLMRLPVQTCGSTLSRTSNMYGFDTFASSICENAPVNTTFLKLDVTDPDLPHTKTPPKCVVTQQFTQHSYYNNMDQLNSLFDKSDKSKTEKLRLIDSKIVTSVQFDRESKSSEQFLIACREEGPSSKIGAVLLELEIRDRYFILLFSLIFSPLVLHLCYFH